MIALDTNIIVRLAVDDEPSQTRAASDLLAGGSRVYLTKTALLETEWVLRHTYSLGRDTVLAIFTSWLGYPLARFEDRGQIEQALEWYESGLDFADALHLASSAEAARFVTFDQKLLKRANAQDVHPPVDLL